ncbi:hypothetical protein OHR68_30570 [Spirillospora sp. NBC_00431]
MADRLGIAFGARGAVAAVWDEAAGRAASLHILDYGRFSGRGGDGGNKVPGRATRREHPVEKPT